MNASELINQLVKQICHHGDGVVCISAVDKDFPVEEITYDQRRGLNLYLLHAEVQFTPVEFDLSKLSATTRKVLRCRRLR